MFRQLQWLLAYPSVGKRVLDLAVSVPLIIILSPLFLLVGLVIRLDSRGPAFFLQERLGKGGVTFLAFKFRTMTARPRSSDKEIYGHADGVTRVGYWLRRFKIDELPQLFNVAKGEMSLVGPRPALPEQLSEYNEFGYRRLCVRPGLTGLAQVHGNIYLSWPKRWIYDAVYVERLSLAMDMWILARTVGVVLFGEDKYLKPALGWKIPSSGASAAATRISRAKR